MICGDIGRSFSLIDGVGIETLKQNKKHFIFIFKPFLLETYASNTIAI
jgi:hypothetical protein